MLSRILFTLSLLAAGSAAYGMSTTIYLLADTTLHPDGSFDRKVEIKTVESGSVNKVTFESHSGRFATVAELTDHLDMDHEPKKFARRYVGTDHLFATEHVYEEIPKKSVHKEKVHHLVSDIAGFFLPIIKQAIAESLHENYDGTLLLDWIDKHMATIWHEWISLYFDSISSSSPISGQKLSAEMEERVLDILNRHDLPSSDLEIIGHLSLPAMLALPDKIPAPLSLKFLRRKSGGSITEDDLGALWKRPLTEAIAVTEEAIEKDFEKLMERFEDDFSGGCFIFCDKVKFHFSMTVPGLVVETTGRLRAANRVEWSFDNQYAFETGYRMRVRSLGADLETQRKFLGRPLFETHEALLNFVDFVEKHEDLLGQLQQARASKQLDSELSLALAHYLRNQGSPDAWLLYCKAAVDGSSEARYILAHWHKKDRVASGEQATFFNFINPDDRAAYVWYTLAEEAGDPRAAAARRTLAGRMSAYQVDVAERMLRERSANSCPFAW